MAFWPLVVQQHPGDDVRALPFITGGFLIVALYAQTGFAAQTSASPRLMRNEYGSSPDNEAELAKQPSEVALFRRNGAILTLLSDGKPVATFTDGDGKDAGIKAWFYLGHVDLTDARSVKHHAWIVEEREAESFYDVVVAPDGAILSMGGTTTVSSSGRLVAGGVASDEIESKSFTIVDWQAHRSFDLPFVEVDKAHISNVITMCQPVSAGPDDRFSVACATEDMSRGIFGEAARRPDGQWQITPLQGFEGEANDTSLEMDKLRSKPVAPEFAAPIILKPNSLDGTTADYARLGFNWLGNPPSGG